MAEAIMRHLTAGQCEVVSAGANPAPRVHPMAFLALDKLGIDTSGLKPKALGALPLHRFDYVVTMCDSAQEQCPVFPGPAARLHWNFIDPVAVLGAEEERQRVFNRVATEILTRVRLWLSLPEIASRLRRT